MSPYGPLRLLPLTGPSTWSQMKAITSIKWASGKQPRPIQKFTGTTAKVELERKGEA